MQRSSHAAPTELISTYNLLTINILAPTELNELQGLFKSASQTFAPRLNKNNRLIFQDAYRNLKFAFV